jgi:tRNA wybutosine-synthesizing protein 1
MINEMRGVPGVLPERLIEGFTVKHCALSLVGEPIMYPRINEMVGELHKRKISTFLVTNAQFPEKISALGPITQLYVSVDASTKDSLKAVDRPLFKDFWDRFLASLIAMKKKKQRTVYRLTLIHGWNMQEAEGYVNLIDMGEPGVLRFINLVLFTVETEYIYIYIYIYICIYSFSLTLSLFCIYVLFRFHRN